MKEWYPYRFKTKEEFVNEFGNWWSNANGQSDIHFITSMEYLFGQPYDVKDLIDIMDEVDSFRTNLHPINRMDDGGGYWIIRKFMLVKNKPTIPNYKPKKIERTYE